MSDETTPEAAVTSGPAARPTAAPRSESPTTSPGASTAAPTGSGSDTAPHGTSGTASSTAASGPAASSSEGTDPTGAPKRRRRRGSRGGRNRRKPGTGTGGANGVGSPSASDRDDDVDDDDEFDDDELGHDYTDAAADRGMTTDDVAEVAMEEAEIEHTPRAPRDPRPPRPEAAAAKPRIGDSRPAPAGAAEVAASNGGAAASADGTAAPKRRRRRGGRGRGRGTGNAGGTGGGTGGGTAPGGGRAQQQSQPRDRGDVVRADLGVGEAPGAPLDDDVLERRRGRTRKGRPAGRYLMCVHVLEGGHTHIGVLEGRSLVEHSLATPTGNESIDGNIYYGRVQNVLPGMEAAFIDIGTPKNGVLYRGDVAFDKADLEGGNKPKIERALKNGQMITVQVTKNPIAHKGARLTQEVSLAGRFLVMVPNEPDTYGISKRLPDDERKRLRKVLDGIRPDDAGLIVRTAAEGATSDELERDVRRLRNQWEQISALASTTKSAKLLYQEPPTS